MIPLQKSTLAFPFGAVDQGKGTRHLLAGELTEAQNVRMIKEDEWRKRPGFDRTVCSSFTGGSPSGVPKEYALVAGSDLWRDGSDQVWSRDSDGNVGYYRGKQQRVFPGVQFGVGKIAPSHEKPLCVLAGGDLWVFSRERYPAGTTAGGYSYAVYDATTRVLKLAPTTINLGGSGPLTALHGWAAAYDSVNSKIWLMMVGLTTAIECNKFDTTSPSTAPTITTYRSVGSRAFNTVDIKKLSNGEFLVVASSFVAGTPHVCYFEHSYLTLTGGSAGTAKTSPAAVATTTNPVAPNPRCCTGARIINYDGANGTAYYALWRTKVDTNIVQLVLVAVNTTTLAISAGPSELVAAECTQTANPIPAACSGYRNPSTGDLVVYGQFDTNDTAKPGVLKVTRYTWNGVASTAAVVARHAVLLSDPFNQGGATDFYFVTGYDDGQTSHAQRTYFLRNQDGGIVSQFLPGEGTGAWHQAVGRDSGGGSYLHSTAFVNALVNPSSGKWMVAVAAEDSANESADTVLVELDFFETYAPPVVLGDTVIYNGPIPQVAGPKDALHDLAPLLSPSLTPTFSLGSGAGVGTFRVAYRYRFRDSSGRVYRSATSATASASFLADGGRQVICESLNHIGAGVAAIEIYGSVAGGTDLYLQQVGENETDSDTSIVAVTPERWTANGELLDTTGGGLSQSPPPPSRCSALWRNRLFLAGCPAAEEIWHSKELQAGRGPEFSEQLVAEWPEGTGAPELLQACDWNYLSVHKTDAIGVLSGPGPDGRGSNGGYLVATLSGQKAGRAGSSVTGPAGCYFQNVQDGRICLLPPGAPAIDIGRGVESHRATSVVAALHVEADRTIWFFLTGGTILVLHYAFPTPSSPYGRWSVWSSPSAVGAAMNGTTPRILESSATVGFRAPGASWVDANSGGNADVLTKLKFDRLRPAGHQVEFMLDLLQFEGQHVGASTLRITVTNDAGATETFTKATTASPLDYMVTPGANTLRTKEFGVTIEETASTTEGFVYDSLAAVIKTEGKLKTPNAANWISPG